MSTDHDIGGMDEGSALVAEYALGVLQAADHESAARRIAADPNLRRELRIWQRRLSSLDEQFAEAAAPASVWNRIESRLFSGAERSPGSLWDSLAFWRSLAAGGLAVAVAAVGFNLMQPRQLSPQEFGQQLVAAIQSNEGSGVEFVALYDTATGSVRLTSLSGEVAPDRDLELWYIKGDEPAVSMGVIPVNQRTEIDLSTEAKSKFAEGTVLAITLEQKGGSPTGKAQGPIVAVGKAMPI
jgi:anti-sigma-K factor RskA